MKLIIVLASHDSDATINESALRLERETRMSVAPTIEAEVLENANKSLFLKASFYNDSNPFSKIPIEKAKSVSIELIAHGDPHITWMVLSLPLDQANQPVNTHVYHNITPSMLKTFLLSIASEGEGKYKFSRLTLFCCKSLSFAKILSALMPEIKIKAFDQMIKLTNDAIPKNEKGEIVAPHVFIDGKEKIENIQLFDYEEKAEIDRAEAERISRQDAGPSQLADSKPDSLVDDMIQAQLQGGIFSQPSSSSSTASSNRSTPSSNTTASPSKSQNRK